MNPYVARLRNTLLPVAFIFGIGAFGLPHALPMHPGHAGGNVAAPATAR
jgi:hypothetical protein